MKHRHKVLIAALVVVALAAALALIATGGHGALAAGRVIYVDADATGANTGSSWEDAYIDLQSALDVVSSHQEIWVAAGTYKPSQEFSPGDPRSATFRMKNDVAIYGGFDPSVDDDAWEERDWEGNPTILSGDLDGDDEPGFVNCLENSYHVLYHPLGTDLDGSAILDGFTISGGNADLWGADYHMYGGGMFNDGSSPALNNCVFAGNRANRGGGMYNYYGSSPALTNCTFSGNSAGVIGGGMYNHYCSPTLVNCTFTDNKSLGNGGGMTNWLASPTLTGCAFEGNSASDLGAGIYNLQSSPTLSDCTFTDNASFQGAGIANLEASSPVLRNCIFWGNSAYYGGGGMYNSASSPVLTNCIFGDNVAHYMGGGMLNADGSAPTLANCAFQGNSADLGQGGGIYNYWSSSPILTNCTFWGNSAVSGGGMFNTYSSSPILTNSILWANTPDEIVNYDTSCLPVVTYSDVEGGYTGYGNISLDPLFVDPDYGDYHLGPDSPCIDVGNNAASGLPEYDLEGDARILDGDGDGTAIVDMGVDEFAPGGPAPMVVEIDIKPKTPSNVIKLGSRGAVPVAILTTGEFAATDADPYTVRFAEAAPGRWSVEDANGDGDEDLVLYFNVQDLVLDASSTEAALTGETYDGVPIEGTDVVRIIQ